MDRFIDKFIIILYNNNCNLKSNMDRFIEVPDHLHNPFGQYLKSNMDRFIESAFCSAFLS